ncbi:MAG TPA: YggT family protein [Gaiellaceae bacterium]|jgi:YggT family protein
MLFDAISAVVNFVYVFTSVYALVIIAYILTSWVQLPYSLRGVQRFLADVCDPYLRFWRRLLPFAVGPIDFSPMVAIIALGVFAEIIATILNRF